MSAQPTKGKTMPPPSAYLLMLLMLVITVTVQNLLYRYDLLDKGTIGIIVILSLGVSFVTILWTPKYDLKLPFTHAAVSIILYIMLIVVVNSILGVHGNP